MRTSIHNGHFKRHLTTLDSGEYEMRSGRVQYHAEQPVQILKMIDGDDEDRVEIQTFHGDRFTVDDCDLHPSPWQPETNVEFVERVMEGRSALTQVMIIQAIEQFAKAVLAAPVKTAEEDNGFVTDAAWRAEAQYILGQFAARDLVEENRRAKVTA